jgi:NO-binding membrane sensor protein with MHYT domain
MMPSHEPWLVALSLFVAFQGSYVGLHLARQVAAAEGMRRRALITAAALTLGLGIWTMHFVGMLALRLPAAVDFLVLPTLLSFLVSVLVVGFAVFAASAGPPRLGRLALAAVFMGTGIVAMHYIGMAALHASVHMTHDPFFVAASALVGLLASGIAIWLGFGVGARRAVLLPAALLGLAIAAMHYAAMAGVTFRAHAGMAAGMPALSQPLLAILVSVVAFVVSGLFLLTLIPERGRREAAGEGPMRAGAAPAAEIEQGIVDGTVGANPQPEGPLAAALAAESAVEDAPGPQAASRRLRSLPVEREGRAWQLDVGHLVAVQAQAHYTQLFDGEQIWFCPLSISEVEAALDPAIFARVHRSHIVNLDRVSALKNAADAPIVAMAAATPYRAPVSRARRRWVKQRLEERANLAE